MISCSGGIQDSFCSSLHFQVADLTDQSRKKQTILKTMAIYKKGKVIWNMGSKNIFFKQLLRGCIFLIHRAENWRTDFSFWWDKFRVAGQGKVWLHRLKKNKKNLSVSDMLVLNTCMLKAIAEAFGNYHKPYYRCQDCLCICSRYQIVLGEGTNEHAPRCKLMREA